MEGSDGERVGDGESPGCSPAVRRKEGRMGRGEGGGGEEEIRQE